MKKLITYILVIVALLSCNNGQEPPYDYREPIAFGSSWVEDVTRAGNDVEFASFKVWGTANNVPVYNGNTVSRANGDWECEKVQYWVPDASYKFTAVVGAEVTDKDSHGMPVTLTYDTESQMDMCYAKATATGKKSNNTKVNFKFSHALARLGFTMSASVAETAITTGVKARFKVTKITLLPADGGEGPFYSSAEFDVSDNNGGWDTSDSEKSAGIELGESSFSNDNNNGLILSQSENKDSLLVNADDKYVMLIPQNLSADGFKVSIEYEVTLLEKNKESGAYDMVYNQYVNHGSGIVKLNLEQNRTYMIKFNIGLEEANVDSHISMTEWVENDEVIINGIVP